MFDSNLSALSAYKHFDIFDQIQSISGRACAKIVIYTVVGVFSRSIDQRHDVRLKLERLTCSVDMPFDIFDRIFY